MEKYTHPFNLSIILLIQYLIKITFYGLRETIAMLFAWRSLNY